MLIQSASPFFPSKSSFSPLSIHFFFFSSRRRHTRFDCDWSSDVCSSDLPVAAQAPSDQRLDRLKTEVVRAIDAKATFAQQMVDQVFSFGELGMQEVETSKYRSEERRVGKECRSRWSPYH